MYLAFSRSLVSSFTSLRLLANSLLFLSVSFWELLGLFSLIIPGLLLFFSLFFASPSSLIFIFSFLLSSQIPFVQPVSRLI